MIAIRTDHIGRRTYTFPPALLEVAQKLFPGKDEAGAVFALARQLTADRFATVAHIAAQNVEIASQRAAEWIKDRPGTNLGQLTQENTANHNQQQ